MIFDSEKQKQQILTIILESPVETTIGGIIAGPSMEVVTLVGAVENATVLSPDEVMRLAVARTKEEEGSA